ncbi:MAG: hypothetical protein RBT45_08145, partial [Acholeplasmataceae bacterium]|nr:hypothetical protein [Acholeplasmataceae bacterium]
MPNEERKEPSRPQSSGHGPGRVMIGEKPKSMKNAFKQLVVYLKPYRFTLILFMVFAMAGAGFSILGPRLLGNITNEVQKWISF